MIHPCPKPRRKKPKSAYPKRKTPLKPGGRIRPKPRPLAEFNRIYGGVDRVEWMRVQACLACGRRGFCDSAHVENGGMGRKADSDKTIPLCGDLWSIVDNCHREFHRGQETFAAKYSLDLQQCAAETEAAWREHQLQEPTK
jgi:hypothetical protein